MQTLAPFQTVYARGGMLSARYYANLILLAESDLIPYATKFSSRNSNLDKSEQVEGSILNLNLIRTKRLFESTRRGMKRKLR